jgi:hypothetical protein
LRKVFEGYDIDCDGYVDRRDFLRMFRAYYVLYKQMHKDILDGLEDQLLASTEAQQLVTSRQPLSSLFGREGGIPPADREMRFEGKTYHRDGSVDVANGFHDAVAPDRPDTANREEILTSLFAYENLSSRQQPRLTLTNISNSDGNWQTVRRLSAHDAEQAYWVALLDPPTSLEELPDVIMGNRPVDLDNGMDEDEDEDDEEEEDTSVDEADEDLETQYARRNGGMPTESEARAEAIARTRLQAPRKEKRRRDMARAQLFDRWRRRQFYLDEEEGGSAPEGWDNDGDVLADIINQTDEIAAESSKSANQRNRSRSSSKVRFAEDTDDYDVRSDPSSSRSIPEKWAGFQVPQAERDAGTEILYQVTQQAFNELLDTIFRPVEDLAIQAAETKHEREKYKHLIDAVELVEEKPSKRRSEERGSSKPREKPIEDKTLEELLSDAGYSIADQEPANNGDSEVLVEHVVEEVEEIVPSEPQTDVETVETTEATEDTEVRDLTMPQFRPNSDSPEVVVNNSGPFYPLINGMSSKARGKRVEENTNPAEIEPSPETLQHWKKLSLAEAKALKRGGWGRLNYDEFAEIYMSQEDRGNRLDYLGSWIDFCIR